MASEHGGAIPIVRKTLDPRSPLNVNPAFLRTQKLFDSMTSYGTPEQIAALKGFMNPDSRYWQHRLYQEKKYDFDKKWDPRSKKWGQKQQLTHENKGPFPRDVDGLLPQAGRGGFIDQQGDNRWYQPVMTPEEFAEYEKSFKAAIDQVYNQRSIR